MSIFLKRTLYAYSILVAVALFWVLRLRYWSQVHEPIFSDMLDYFYMAQRFLYQGTLEQDSFWLSYRPPVLPILGAGVFGLVGFKILAWQIFLAALTVGGAWWAGYEFSRAAERRWILPAFLFVVAFSRSSIFWSLKFATEGTAEAFLYYAVASTLRAYRTRSLVSFMLAGMFVAISQFNRSNFIIIPPLLIAGLLLEMGMQAIRERSLRAAWRSNAMAAILAFGLALAIVWAPWIARSYNLYGVPLVSTTGGPYHLIFELGDINIRMPDGHLIVNNNQLLSDSSKWFANDLEASKYATVVFKTWLAQHSAEYIRILGARVHEQLFMQSVWLTKVPRDNLFNSRIEWLLLDKKPVLLVLGLLGLILLPFTSGRKILVLVPLLVLAPWLLTIPVVGTSRMFEPVIPFVLFGNAAWVMLAHALYLRSVSDRPEFQSPRVLESGA